MNLKKELLEQQAISTKKMPDDIKSAVKNKLETLEKENFKDNALKEGDKIPNFSLKNYSGDTVNIYDLLDKKAPLVLNFFRGSWCPYCNLELIAYKEIYDEIKKNGADIVAISPGLPNKEFKLEENNSLPFQVLADVDNKVGKQFGLVFSLGEDLTKKYKNVGIDLEENQGNKYGEIPIPATYIIDKNGEIVFSYVDIDYHKRFEPSEVLKLLKDLTDK